MNTEQTQSKLLSIFNKVFPDNKIRITLHAKPQDIDAWDSLGHMMLISEIEQGFNIKFDFEEMLDLDSVSNIFNAVYAKIGS